MNAKQQIEENGMVIALLEADLLAANNQIQELTRVIARNLVAWDTSKDKREGLLPEVYLTNKVLYKKLTGEEYFMHKAMEKFQIGDDYS